MNMPQGGMGVALQSSRTTAHWILGRCDHATWPMVSIEKSDATGGIQRAADRSDAAFSPAGRNHGRLDARHRSGIPTSLRLDVRINQRLARTLRRYREDQKCDDPYAAADCCVDGRELADHRRIRMWCRRDRAFGDAGHGVSDGAMAKADSRG